MSLQPTNRPFIQAWLKRVDRQLRGSGHISQIAYTLSQIRGGEADEWSRQIRQIILAQQVPDPELIADIDQILAHPLRGHSPPIHDQLHLFQ